MSNVIQFDGAMHPRHYVRVKLSEAELDSQIASNRERHDAANEARSGPVSTLQPVSVIQLDSGLGARLLRWLRGLR